MKTYLLTLMLVLTSCLACQPTTSAQTKHNESISKEQFRKKQRDFIIREARLSPKEASYFFPLFFELQDKKKLLTDDADAKRKKALEEKLDEKQYKSAVDQILNAHVNLEQLEREYVDKLPSYLKDGYEYLRYTNVTSSSDGTFGEFKFDKRFAFCDITNYFIEQALQSDFYAIKCAYGGTAIDTAATYAHLPVWCADAEWIADNNAYRGDINTGKSLTKSLTEGFADCVDVTLSKLQQGYDVKAIMWHQGESDRKLPDHYYKNFKDMITYMRNAIYAKTGRDKDKTLPFIFGTVSHESKQYSKGVEEAQLKVAAELPNVYYIDMSDAGLRSDALHFDSAWTEYLGKQMYNKLVELKLVDGNKIEVSKPHKPSASDTLQVDAERHWDFSAAWSEETIAKLQADSKWPTFQKLGYRYSSAMPEWQELATSGGYVFPETKGLLFKCSTGNRIIVNSGNNICLYADNLYMEVPKVKPGQTVTIVTESAKGERGLTTDSEEYLELVSGGGKSSGKVINVWRVKETLKEPVDLVFHSDGGAIYVYSVQVASPYVQILVGADGKVTFSSDKSCSVKPYSDMIKAYSFPLR